jgi:ribonuclease-3
MQTKIKELQRKIKYHFQNEELLISALMHSSYTNESHLPKYKCNERLEFLGDAVLEIISSEFLFFANSKMPEGKLTKMRASMVCESSLAFCAREIDLGAFLLLGKGEDATGGRDRDSIISDALEALIGAIYLDGGFASAKEFIMEFVLNDLENKKLFYDSKTILQEMIQSQTNCELIYKLVGQDGPDHNKTFYVEAYVGDTFYGAGKGRTKKAAEQEAAYKAILTLRGKDKK